MVIILVVIMVMVVVVIMLVVMVVVVWQIRVTQSTEHPWETAICT